ncbi:hypothetical protein TNCV_4445311 [Trichonephila clavipes]|nr:hypothetical protein TNCV_4445311 [Trichonephila clavipes]
MQELRIFARRDVLRLLEALGPYAKVGPGPYAKIGPGPYTNTESRTRLAPISAEAQLAFALRRPCLPCGSLVAKELELTILQKQRQPRVSNHGHSVTTVVCDGPPCFEPFKMTWTTPDLCIPYSPNFHAVPTVGLEVLADLMFSSLLVTPVN